VLDYFLFVGKSYLGEKEREGNNSKVQTMLGCCNYGLVHFGLHDWPHGSNEVIQKLHIFIRKKILYWDTTSSFMTIALALNQRQEYYSPFTTNLHTMCEH